MKNNFLFALLLGPGLAMAQTPFTIKGQVGKHNAPTKAYLFYGENNMPQDSAILNNGSFLFKGNLQGQSTVKGAIVLDHKGQGLRAAITGRDVKELFFAQGQTTVNSKDSVVNAVVSGEANKAFAELNTALKPLDAEQAAVYSKFRNATPEQQKSQDFVAPLQSAFNDLNDKKNDVRKKFIMSHPANYVSAELFAEIAGQQPNEAELKPYLDALSPALRNTSPVKRVLARVEAGRKTAIGATAIDFTQNDVDGKPVTLSNFRGKYVLIDFWASWCGPCRQENPNVVKAYNKFKDKNFTIIGISLDRPNGKEAWLKAIKDDGLAWTQVSDLKFWQNEVAVAYGVRGIPQNYLIDPAGKIVASNLRGEALEKKLAELLP